MLDQDRPLTLLSDDLPDLGGKIGRHHEVAQSHLGMGELHEVLEVPLRARKLGYRRKRSPACLTRGVNRLLDVRCEPMMPLSCLSGRNLKGNGIEGLLITGCVVAHERSDVRSLTSHDYPFQCAEGSMVRTAGDKNLPSACPCGALDLRWGHACGFLRVPVHDR